MYFLIDCIHSARLDSITRSSREGICLQAVSRLHPHHITIYKRLFKEKYEGAAGIPKYDESQRVDLGQSIYSALVVYSLREKLHRTLNSIQEFFVRGLLQALFYFVACHLSDRIRLTSLATVHCYFQSSFNEWH
jgi:hypothetical protein